MPALKFLVLKNHRVLSFLLTTVLCVAAFVGAFLLRFDLHAIPAEHLPCLWIGLPIMVAIRLITLRIFGVNRGLYRYVSIDDFVKLSKAIALGSGMFVAIWLTFLNNFYFMPRSIFIIEAILCMSILAGSRVGVRLWRSRRKRQEQGESNATDRALIIGAGSMGESIFRMVDRRFLGQDYDVVGFADDNERKQGS